MRTLQELISVTRELNDLLDHVTLNNREDSIQQIKELLLNRESILHQLDLEAAKADPLVKQLLLDETAIKQKMQELLNDIKKDLLVLNKKRSLGENYINSYQSLNLNGAFFDKKQ